MIRTQPIRSEQGISGTRRGLVTVVGVAALAVSLGTIATSAAPAQAKATTATPAFGPKEAPLGKSYANWLGDWTKWAFSESAANNPLLALQACDTWVQPDPTKVWFLSANGPGAADVTCAVPTNLPIAITPGGIFDWKNPGEEAKLVEYMKTFPTSVRKPTLSVDGVKVDATKYLVTTDILTTKVVAPEFGPNTGPNDVVIKAKGWMLVLKGLPAGPHKVTISDELSNLDDNGQPVLVKGKPSWIVSKVNYTLNVGTGPAPAASAAAPAPTTPATPALVLTPTNGLKIGTAVAAGTYDAKVGKYTARILIPANTTTDLVDPESVMFTNNKNRQLAIFSDPQTFADPLFDQKDFSGQLKPFFASAAAFETFLRSYPIVDLRGVSDYTVAGIAVKRFDWGLREAPKNRTGDFNVTIPHIGSGFIPFAAYFDAKTPTTEVTYVLWAADRKPLVFYVSVPKGEDADAFLKSMVTSIS
jgi:hypothetical protein